MSVTPETLPSSPAGRSVPTSHVRLRTAIAFALGLALAGGGTFFTLQNGVLANMGQAAPPPASSATVADPRLERLLSLTESQRDCDSTCLGELRGRADKAAALEQALTNMQVAADEVGSRVAALETEKAGLASEAQEKSRQAETLQAQIQTLQAEKTDLAAQVARQTAAEAEQKQKIAALEAEKTALAGQAGAQEVKLADGHRRQVEALEREKTALATQLAELRAGQQKQAGAAVSDQATRQGGRTGAQERRPRQVPAAAAPVDMPAAKPAAGRAGRQTATPTAGGPQWTILGMTASTVVVSMPGHKVVALAAGESLDGITVHHIDLDKGVAQTSVGELLYAKK